jgi:phosphoribosylaminoimidazolecarboxamide formyltransferase/IMP cyclohydrolase
LPHIRRALISVSDKRGLLDFAHALRSLEVEIISTGGTLSSLRHAGIEARAVADVTGFPEILDGRVKTLHPKIHGALLGRPDLPAHREQMASLGIESIDLVVVTLYPFEQTIARPGVTLEEAIEQIDIGGPSMLRSAAKNWQHKAVVVHPGRYDALLTEMRASGGSLSADTCYDLACEVFRTTATYDAAIATYLAEARGGAAALPPVLAITAPRELDLRYGENPHQRAALYGDFGRHFVPLHGKALSFNNITDLAAAAELVSAFDEPTVVIVKHMNPCGVGSGATLAEAYAKAFATDREAPFGGIVAVNRPLDRAAAESINAVFTEVVVAPSYPEDVLAFLRVKKDRRIVESRGDLRGLRRVDIRSVPGGYLAQDADRLDRSAGEFRVVTRRAPTPDEERALRFGWTVVAQVKSNAIVFAGPDRTLGIGAGQMSRVESVRLAAAKASTSGLDLRGSAVASDAYFPFADGVREAARAGATAVVQPGGSIRDAEVIQAANDLGMAMVFTGIRHFRH